MDEDPQDGGTAAWWAAAAATWRGWLPIGLVAVTAAALRLAGFGRVRLNPFYDAAVRSMGLSWHNFFYGAFEPGGQVSIDKTPVDLWLQVASTKALGFTSVALRLPEACAGILAVLLLYDVVRRVFGREAGVMAAAALAVLPISVVTSRSDTMDSLMMLLVLGAAWLTVRWGETGRTRAVVGAGAVLGVAFNVKLFEALIAAPALLVLAVLVADRPWRRLVAPGIAAAAAFASVALSWLVAVSLSPVRGRPYPIGSTNGSVWNVVFGYNGADRLRVAQTAKQTALDPPGVARLLTTTGVHHGRLIGTMLVAAVALAAVAVVCGAWREARTAGRLPRAGAAFFGVWPMTGLVLFSAMGRLRPRYLEAFTPAVAAVVGVCLVWLAGNARGRGSARAGLAAAAVAAALLSPRVAVLGRFSVAAPATVAAAVGAALAVVLAVLVPRLPHAGPRVLAAAVAVALLAVPAASSVHLMSSGASSAGRPGYAPPRQVAALSRFLAAHTGSEPYEVASSAVAQAGPLIVLDGRPILMLTSLYDRPLLTAPQLADKVAAGQVRYVLLSRRACVRPHARCAAPVRWARDHGADVSGAAGQPVGTLFQMTAAGG